MSPRDFTPSVIQARLRQMRELLEDIAALGPVTAEELDSDRLRRYVVHQILTQLVQLAVAINSHLAASLLGRAVPGYRESFDAAVDAGALPRELGDALKPSVGLRNVLVHEYLDVDESIVADAVPVALLDYARYVVELARWLAERHPV